MSNVFENWSTDHRNFAYLLDRLEEQVELFLEDETPRYDLMLDILYYMTHYPDLFHHPKEDLVAARVRELDATTCAVLDELAQQHEILRESGTKLLELLDEIVDGSMLTRESVAQSARTYIAYFRNHMQKEESDVLPLMQSLLKKEDWDNIERAAPSRKDPLFGNGALEKRYEVLHQQIVREAGSQKTG